MGNDSSALLIRNVEMENFSDENERLYIRHLGIEMYSLMKKAKALKPGRHLYQIFNAGYMDTGILRLSLKGPVGPQGIKPYKPPRKGSISRVNIRSEPRNSCRFLVALSIGDLNPSSVENGSLITRLIRVAFA